MKDFHFYAEMPEGRKSKSASKAYPFQPWTRATLKRYAAEGRHVNVCAVLVSDSAYLSAQGDVMREAISALLDQPNSPVCGSSASRGYLDKRTVRIDEATARLLHPALFAYLDA
jgi:hypothetical protein